MYNLRNYRLIPAASPCSQWPCTNDCPPKAGGNCWSVWRKTACSGGRPTPPVTERGPAAVSGAPHPAAPALLRCAAPPAHCCCCGPLPHEWRRRLCWVSDSRAVLLRRLAGAVRALFIHASTWVARLNTEAQLGLFTKAGGQRGGSMLCAAVTAVSPPQAMP